MHSSDKFGLGFAPLPLELTDISLTEILNGSIALLSFHQDDSRPMLPN